MSFSKHAVFTVFLVAWAAILLSGCQTGKDVPGEKIDEIEKIKITRLDELPRHTYPLDMPVSELIQSREKLADLACLVRSDIEEDLDKYEINDPTTIQNMVGQLMTIDLFEGNYDDALEKMEKIRSYEDKEASRLTTGLETKAYIAAIRETDPKKNPDLFRKVFKSRLQAQVENLPWDVVQDQIKQSKGQAEIMSKNLIQGMVQGQMDPMVAKTGEISSEMATSVIGLYSMINNRLWLKDERVAVYQAMVDANITVKPDIWAKRSVELKDDQNGSPVLMAAWDSGTDTEVFKNCLFVNEKEKINGIDDDGNGYVDDRHGIAFNIKAERTAGLLYPLGDAEARMKNVMSFMKGFMDLQSSLDTKEAADLKKHLGSLDPSKVKGFIEDLGLAGNYSHGTHVAGLMTEGNPFARLMVARLSYDHKIPPVVRDLEWGQRDGDKCRDTVEYFKQHGVRVVNMSWGESMADAEDSYEQNGVGANAEERREMARKVFAMQKQGLYDAIKNAPGILFICAAGNSDNDVEFDEFIPSSFDLPNLMVVGAVDQAGDPTGFTSFGDTVSVYANGFEVDSYVPGGERMKMSGTSMASPNVANLAGKLLAMAPQLSPPEVIDLIKKGADETAYGNTNFLLMNPKRSMKLLKK